MKEKKTKKRRSVMLALDMEDYQLLLESAQKEDRPVGNLIRRIILKYLEDLKK